MTPDQSLAAGRQRELAILAQQRELRAELREIRAARLRLLDELSTPRPLLDAIDAPPGQPASTVGHPHGARTVPDAAKGGEA